MPSACAARISGAPTAAPPTATSFSEAGARWPLRIRWPHQARSICGSRIRLCGWWRCTAAWNSAASKLDDPVRPSSRQGQRDDGRTLQARRHQAGDVFQQHRKGQGIQVALDAAAAPSPRPAPCATRCSAAALRHTPLGAPVVPEVKLIFAVCAGSATAADGRRACIMRLAGHLDRLPAQRRPGGGQRGGHQQRVHAGGLQRMLHLRRAEELRQRHMHDATLLRRLVQRDEGGAVVQHRGQHARAGRAPASWPASATACIQLHGAPDAPAVVQRRPHAATLRRASICSAASSRPASTSGRWS